MSLRHRLSLLLGAAASLVALAVVAPSGEAATGAYVHLACSSGSAISDGSGGFGPFNTHPGQGDETSNTCAGGGNLKGDVHPASGYSFPVNARLGWIYNAPQNTQIVGQSLRLYGWVDSWDGNNQGLIEITGNSSGRLAIFTSGNNPTINATTNLGWDNLHESSISYAVGCDAPSTAYPDCGPPWETGFFQLDSIATTLSDAHSPTVGGVSGAAVTDATWKGTKHLAYAAGDQGGGIFGYRLYVDGTLIKSYTPDSNGGHCSLLGTSGDRWVFGYPAPCPVSVDGTDAIDTTKIADGSHTITAKVVDAAQREATIFSGTRLVANNPPVNTKAPAYVTSSFVLAPKVGATIEASGDGSWTGAGLTITRNWQRCDAGKCYDIDGATGLVYTAKVEDVGRSLRLRVTAQNVAGSVTVTTPLTGVVTANESSTGAPTPKPENGSAKGGGGSSVIVSTSIAHTFIGQIAGEPAGLACPGDEARLTLQGVKGTRIRLKHGRDGAARVLLTCAANGKVITHAPLQIASRVGAGGVVASDATTDDHGIATVPLSKGPSRTVVVGDRMYADDTTVRATTRLSVAVRARVTLRGNHRRLHNGRALRLIGRLVGGYVPRRGVNLAVQWKDGRKWRPFAQITTSRKGTFHYAYRFTRTTRRVRYQLRVQIAKGQVDYPFDAAPSNAVTVTVVP